MQLERGRVANGLELGRPYLVAIRHRVDDRDAVPLGLEDKVRVCDRDVYRNSDDAGCHSGQ